MLALVTTRDDDAALAARCASGDRAAQRDLFLRSRTAVHRTLFRVLGGNQDVEDLLQETYLAVFRSMGSYGGRASLTTWCCAIATNLALSHLRRRRATPLAEIEVESDAPSADRLVRARNAVVRLYRALDRIDPVQRVAFALAVIDGRSMAEVAELTGASVPAVKTQVWRARKALDKRAAADPLLREYLHDLAGGDDAEEAG
ncbi:MAG: RNA polymerase sigma factor [Kofleriaceae bacterium]|nr:RNA polymerase sigma factor [Kofleriaceae bacterium]MBP9166946.1 RNA polymerase sigma factor [Kofleriaceae bacterium]MBP9862446.1 RNA polymerase sigma factor [Kofleriaceae bacterium]